MDCGGRIRSADHPSRSQHNQEVLRSIGRLNGILNILSRRRESWHQESRTVEMPAIVNTRHSARHFSNEKIAITVLLSKVFPVPEGPAIKKLAMGLAALPSPLRESRMAFATALTASGCPTTFSANTFSILRSFSFSVDTSLVTGMDVHRPTISAICSGVTTSEPPPPATSSSV